MLQRHLKVRSHVNPILWNYRSGAAYKMWVLIILNVLDSGIKTASPWILFKALDDLISFSNDQEDHKNPDYEQEVVPILMVTAFVIAWSIGQVMPDIRKNLTTSIKSSLANNLIEEILDVSMHKSLEFHQVTPTGSIAQSILNTFTVGSNYVPGLYQNMMPASLETLAITGAIGGLINWKLALCVLGSTGIFTVIAYVGNRRIPALEKQRVEARKEMAGVLLEVLGNYEAMHHFANENFEMEKVRSALKKHKITADKSENGMNNAELARNLWLGLSYMAIIPFAAHQYVTEELNFNDMVMLLLYLLQQAPPLNLLASSFNQLEVAIAELEKTIDFINEGGDIREGLNAAPLTLTRTPSIEFQNVSLFQNDGKSILDKVSFIIPGGSRIAFVGISGSGKTTISRLLYRFIDPDEGQIFIDGQDIASCTINSLRKAIGIVPQQPILFNDTLKNNVHYGNRDVEDEESIVNALRAAGLGNDLDSGKLKLEQTVGQRGSQLSGGQLQRVSIARLILKDPSIVFLDEATSALDIETRVNVTNTLAEVTYGYTTIIVTHELSLVVNVDRIYVFDQGKLVEEGTFDELINEGEKQLELARGKEIEEEDDEEVLPLKVGHFYRMFYSYAKQLGQSVNEVASSIPRVVPTQKRRMGFFTQSESSIRNSIQHTADSSDEESLTLISGQKKRNVRCLIS